MGERFSAFSLVDRITAAQPGSPVRGTFHIPARIDRFPPSLCAEAVGQLAAWCAMSALDFERRPVAGLAGETRFLRPVAPGETLHLVAQIDSVSDDDVAYHGWAEVGGERVIELEHCLGPMLPQDEFDDPARLRADYATLTGAGAAPDRFAGVPQPAITRTEHVAGTRIGATLSVPQAASFFGDHFPRKPVFPATLLLDALTGLAVELASEGGHRARLERVNDVKMRAFIPPGETLELAVELAPASGSTRTGRMSARMAGKTIATARVTLAVGGHA